MSKKELPSDELLSAKVKLGARVAAFLLFCLFDERRCKRGDKVGAGKLFIDLFVVGESA